MTTQYTPILKIALPVTGELSGTWGDVVNDNITSMFEQAIAGLATISTWSANSHTLTTANGTTSESRCAMLVAADGAGLAAAGEIICPAASKLYVLKNGSSYALTLKTAGGTGVAVAAGETAFLFCDGTNVNACVTTIINGRITGNLTVDGNATINGNTTLGNATSDTITATARFASDLVPSTDNARDLGSTGNSWKDLYIDGTGYLALVDINGGTIDGVSIGASTAATIINVDNLRLDGNTISSTDTNGNVVIAPNGTGDVQLDADTVRVGDSGAAATLTSNGAGALTVTTGGAANLVLSTNSGTDSGTITINNGANGNIAIVPNGTGDVQLDADTVRIGDANTDVTLTSNGTGNLNLSTNGGTNSGTIQIAQGANASISLTPNGTGTTVIKNPSINGTTTFNDGTANGVIYLNGSKQATAGSALTFDGATLGVTSGSSGTPALKLYGAAVSQGQLQFSSTAGYGIAGGPDYTGLIYNVGSAAYQHIWQINSSEQMRLTSTGLGIGTSSPGAKLDVKGGSTISTLAGWNTLSNSMFELANPAVRFGIGYDSSDQVLLQGFDSSNAARNIGMQVYGGNLGIGTSLPNGRLHVNSIGTYTTPTEAKQIVLGESSGNNNFRLQLGYMLTNSTTWQGSIQSFTSGVVGNLILNGEGGNVGINNTSPNAPLHVLAADATTANLARFQQTNQGNLLIQSQQGGQSIGGANGILFSNATGNMGWRTNASSGNANMLLNQSGSLGVGTVDPVCRLHLEIPAVTNANTEILRATDGTYCDFKVLLNRQTTVGNSISRVNTAAGNMSFETSNTERARINADGNTSFGTTSAYGRVTSDGGAGYGFAAQGGDYGLAYKTVNLSAGGIDQFFIRHNLGSVELGTASGRGSLNIFVNGSETTRFDGAGNVAVGFPITSDSGRNITLTGGGDGTAAQAPYFVTNSRALPGSSGTSFPAGGLLFSAYRDVRNPAYQAGITLEAYNASGVQALARALVFRINQDVSGTTFADIGSAALPAERVRITSAGRVGISTTTPQYLLSLGNAQGRKLAVYDDGVGNVASGLGIDMSGSSYELSFWSGAPGGGNGIFTWGQVNTTNGVYTERMRLDNNGRVQIGATTPLYSASLTLQSAGNSYNLTSSRVGAGTGTVGHVVFENDNGAVGTIQTNGSSTIYNTSSDYRLKNITGPITTSGAYIDSLNPVEGTWKVDGAVFVGLVAHEAQAVSRTVVATGEKDGEEMQSMDYGNSEFIANIIAELQSLRKRVAQLEQGV